MLRWYMKPRSLGSAYSLAPAASALATKVSTSARVSTEMASRVSVTACASAMGFRVNVAKKDSTSSITLVLSLTIMQVAFSSVNFGSNEKPSAAKKSTVRPRSFTGRLT